MATTRYMTANDLIELPDDGWQYELHEGVLVRMSPGGGVHSEFELLLASALVQFTRQHRLGKVYGGDGGFRLGRNPDTVLVPDVAFVRHERLPQFSEQVGFLPLAPDLAVEILSPSNRSSEFADKVRRYLTAGTTLVWVIDPLRRRAAFYRPDQQPIELTEDDVLDGEDVLPGFKAPLSEFWPE